MRPVIILAGLLSLAACKAAVTGPAIGTAEATKIAEAAEASFTSGNVQAIMSHYAPDAVMFDSGNNAASRDRATQSKWTQSLVALQPRNFNSGKRIIQPLGPDAFISSGIASLDVVTGQGMQTVHIRYTDVFQKQADGQWRIVHEHGSSLPAPAAPL